MPKKPMLKVCLASRILWPPALSSFGYDEILDKDKAWQTAMPALKIAITVKGKMWSRAVPYLPRTDLVLCFCSARSRHR